MITMLLPWPDDTSLNSRLHWAKRSSANRDHQLEGMLAAREAVQGVHPVVLGDCIQARIVFHPPNKRKRDLDNMLARVKKQLDGACSALGVDDSSIKRITLEWGDMVYSGSVVVTVESILSAE
jgi:crossover junction endodeoxyribonuclease RusA